MILQASAYTTLNDYMQAVGKQSRQAARSLALASPDVKRTAIRAMANTLRDHKSAIFDANAKDMKAAEERGISGAMLDRLMLDEARLEGIASSLEAIADQAEPVGQVEEEWDRPNGLKFRKVRIPIGVIGMIYESRPNVTADAAALCVKSGNAVILRGGSEAVHSNHAIHAALMEGLTAAGLDDGAVQLLTTQDRDAVGLLLSGLEESVDLIIPRGGKGLVARVQSDARVPVLAHLDGLNHTYIHESADTDMAVELVSNAKMRRTGVCGATETVLVDEAIAEGVVPRLVHALNELNCEVRADKAALALSDAAKPASEDDFATEHLAPICNLGIVRGIDAALAHIDRYGSGHTDAIVASDASAAERFLTEVDSAIVVHNASTQFADGGEFGFGAEIGIATGRLHARGPVGAKHLTTFKYNLIGDGTTRP